MSGFTSAALRELLVTPEMNPLMSKFLESQPDTSVLSPPSTSHQVRPKMIALKSDIKELPMSRDPLGREILQHTRQPLSSGIYSV